MKKIVCIFIFLSIYSIQASNRKFNIGKYIEYFLYNENRSSGILKYYIAKIDLNKNLVKITTQLANKFILGKERTSDIAKRENAVIAVNGAFYANNGDPLGMIILDHKIVSVPILDRAAFGITETGNIIFGNPYLKGNVEIKGNRKIDINGINQIRLKDQVILFTPEFGFSTRTSFYGQEITILNNKVVSVNTCNSIIPPNGFVVAYHGDKIERFDHVELYSKAIINISLDEKWNNVKYAIGAGPWLVKDGKKYITAKRERFQADVIDKRAPRTAVGLTADNHLILLVVDGRKKGWSVGCDLNELADILIKNKVVNAINMDGGGSSTFCVNGTVINRPSDGKERKISNAILVNINRGNY